MIHYGTEPPWQGGGRYGEWVRGAELWDGSGCIWTWKLGWYDQQFFYSRSPLAQVNAVLMKDYVSRIQELLNTDRINWLKDEA